MKPARVPIRREQYLIFFAGLFIGIVFTVLWKRLGSFDFISPLGGFNGNNYRVYVVRELENAHAKHYDASKVSGADDESHGGHGGDWHAEPDAHHHSDIEHAAGPTGDVIGQHTHDDEDDFVSRTIYSNVRILCWIMTGPQNHESKARHVKATWAKRCNKFVFMSSKVDDSLPSIKINVAEGRNALWGKTKRAYQWCYDNHLNDFDWFLKADDDTYVVVENLRFLLSNHSPEEPVYYGKRFKPFTKQGYMSGGAGYVLSREALRRFVEIGLKKPNSGCKTRDDTGAEDAEMGKCLDALGVKAGDSLDEQKRSKFFPFSLEHHLTHKHDPDFWYWKYTMDDEKPGFDCCSDFAISFHYITPNQMYLYDFLIYHLRPYGVTYEYELPKRIAQLARRKPTGTLTVGSNKTVTVAVPAVALAAGDTDVPT